MGYMDKPRPSRGYVSYYMFIIAVFFLICLLLTFIVESRDLYSFIFGVSFNFGYFYICFLPMAFAIALVIHAAYNTEYLIEEGKLWMKFGPLSKKSVSLDEIESIERVKSVPVIYSSRLVWNWYCNRFKNVIRIATKNKIIWVSPEDNDRFIQELYKDE
jgi:uncharacterized membrane protein YdbT with pleckstrin-like domain